MDKLGKLDIAFIIHNKLSTVFLVYFTLQFAWNNQDHVEWDLRKLTIQNTIVSLVLMYVLYDLIYWAFHAFLHIRQIYPYVHKHHHQQHAPSRGNNDAVNVHPFEFLPGTFFHLSKSFSPYFLHSYFLPPIFFFSFPLSSYFYLGEFLHLFCIYFIPTHIVSILIFLLLGGILATLNHTRFDVTFSKIFDSKAHDMHHRIPTVNYSQFTMLWDRIFGTYREYQEPRFKRTIKKNN